MDTFPLRYMPDPVFAAAEQVLPTQADCRTQARNRAFWGEMSPCEHTVQIYGTNESFLDTLEAFVVAGLEAGDAVIVIATEAHRRSLEKRLLAGGTDVEFARSLGCYIP